MVKVISTMNIAIVRPKHLHPPSVQIGVAPAALGKISYEIYIHRVPVSWLLGDLTAGEDLIGKMNCSSSALCGTVTSTLSRSSITTAHWDDAVRTADMALKLMTNIRHTRKDWEITRRSSSRLRQPIASWVSND